MLLKGINETSRLRNQRDGWLLKSNIEEEIKGLFDPHTRLLKGKIIYDLAEINF